MTKLTTSLVKHIAKLAKLELNAQEIEKFKTQLSEIINYINELSKVEVKNFKPTSQTTNLKNVSRNDEVNSKDNLTPEGALSGSDEIENNFFKIPRILEKES